MVSGNQQLLKGAIFALVSLCWFSFLFAFVNMDWARVSPLAPFLGPTAKEDYLFYFLAFSFFITTLIFSTIFYRNNLQPTDLLMRFGVILVIFWVLFILYLFFHMAFFPFREMFVTCLENIGQGSLVGYAYLLMSFVSLYFVFFPVILFFSKIFFDGFFGAAGYIMCVFITVVFMLVMGWLVGMEHTLFRTRYPLDDLVMIVFFTLVAFGVGVSSGEEPKPKRTARLSPVTQRLKTGDRP